MPDYGRPLEFGLSLPPSAEDLGVILDAAEAADGALDLIGVQDHPYQRRFLDTTALLATIAARTSQLRVFHDVACLPLRHPSILANEAASIDIMSGGRFELGLGAGSFWDAIVGMGGPRRSPGEALEALDEAVEVIRLLWSGERGLQFEGEHYTLEGIHSGPLPAHDIEIWFGVYGPRACALLGRVADGWIPSLGRSPIEELAQRHEIIDESAKTSGRDPRDIRRLLNVSGTITDGRSEGRLVGPEDRWVEELASLALEHGFDTFIFWPQTDTIDQIRRFSGITDAVRQLVANSR
ncbi:MAG: LLM class flavin-dependent oxidoreductase [Actinobacteria bacterium]|nr:MAG: LLM class flavin-dependent oxidoreductase [Actinomycetota bacterium]REK38734.1 MAG: LLM class flavin-dependent oxidoreductase [Actinomycetota bacterium]